MNQPSPQDCGCCDGIGVQGPSATSNRPGLPAIAYRVGTYASFRQSLHARLSDSRWAALRGLRTRAEDDFTIALLDAWAITAADTPTGVRFRRLHRTPPAEAEAAFAFLVVINLLIALDGDSPWAWMAVGWSAAFYLTNLVNAVKSNG